MTPKRTGIAAGMEFIELSSPETAFNNNLKVQDNKSPTVFLPFSRMRC
jgi:hypothetical protein